MRRGQRKPERVLVFGEDDHDRQAFVDLVQALVPTAPKAEKRRKPLVLIRGRAAAEQRTAADQLARVIKADQVRHRVRAVIAHEDCDAVEPAHVELARHTERLIEATSDVPGVAPAPAWEFEAWLYQRPRAVAAWRPTWTPLTRTGNVGKLTNAKEKLRRDLRPGGRGRRPPDYTESDGPEIVKKAIELGELEAPAARVQSKSYERFVARLREVLDT